MRGDVTVSNVMRLPSESLGSHQRLVLVMHSGPALTAMRTR